MTNDESLVQPNHSTYLSEFEWKVEVGWLRGKVFLQAMIDWCETVWPVNPNDIRCWSCMKGGTFFFRSYDDAMAFALAWVNAPLPYNKVRSTEDGYSVR